MLCMMPDDPEEMTYVKVHNDCLKGLLRRVRPKSASGAPAVAREGRSMPISDAELAGRVTAVRFRLLLLISSVGGTRRCMTSGHVSGFGAMMTGAALPELPDDGISGSRKCGRPTGIGRTTSTAIGPRR
jgi:hypothetical protein